MKLKDMISEILQLCEGMQKFFDEQYDQLSPELQDTKAHTRVIDWMPMDKVELDKDVITRIFAKAADE